jgi:thymidylate synthase (FAD)
MKIIKPSVDFFGAVPTDYENTLRFIEVAGRTCYKSEDKITATSAEGFVKKLINARHLAMVEHSNFVVRALNVGFEFDDHIEAAVGKYLSFQRLKGVCHIGGSLTAWYQNAVANGFPGYTDSFVGNFGKIFNVPDEYAGGSDWQVCPHNEIPKALHRYSAKFICDRGVSHELVRHRPCSFAQESTRYVNYGGKDMEFIEPWWCNDAYGANNGAAQWSNFEQMCLIAEGLYKDQLRRGQSPQAARAILPNALKTEIVVTADASEWAHIKKLRTHPSAHPDMVRLMNMMPWEEMGL